MGKMCKEMLKDFLLASMESDISLIEHEPPQVEESYIEIPFSMGGLLTEAGEVSIEGRVTVFDDGYYIISEMAYIAAKSAIPELIRFAETVNSYIPYGDITVDQDAGVVVFRTYERFWDGHRYNEKIFYDAMQKHLEANRNFSIPVGLLIKGASSTSSQIKQLRKQGVL